jgi:hypothetical protein
VIVGGDLARRRSAEYVPGMEVLGVARRARSRHVRPPLRVLRTNSGDSLSYRRSEVAAR